MEQWAWMQKAQVHIWINSKLHPFPLASLSVWLTEGLTGNKTTTQIEITTIFQQAFPTDWGARFQKNFLVDKIEILECDDEKSGGKDSLGVSTFKCKWLELSWSACSPLPLVLGTKTSARARSPPHTLGSHLHFYNIPARPLNDRQSEHTGFIKIQTRASERIEFQNKLQIELDWPTSQEFGPWSPSSVPMSAHTQMVVQVSWCAYWCLAHMAREQTPLSYGAESMFAWHPLECSS